MYEQTLFTSAALTDVTMISNGPTDPQAIHQVCVENFQGQFSFYF